MFYWLANLVALLHGLLICGVVVGALMAVAGVLRRYPRWERAYYALIAALIASDLFLGECALTGLEQLLRNLDRPGSAYKGSFIGHYFPFLPRFIHQQIGPALIIGSILALLFWRYRDARARRGAKV